MPDPGDTKAGDRGQGTSSSGGLKGGSGSGNKSGVGGGGGGGGGSTGSRGSSTGGVGAGNGSNAPGNRGAGGSSGGLGGGGQNNGAGRDSSRGLGQGAGGSAIGRGGGNLGGGGQNSPGSSPSSPGGLRGAGGNYGPGSGRPGSTSSNPRSPMSGQGTSYRSPEAAQIGNKFAGNVVDLRGLNNYPNDPITEIDNAINRAILDETDFWDSYDRSNAAVLAGDLRNPQEIREAVERVQQNFRTKAKEREIESLRNPIGNSPQSQLASSLGRMAASNLTPNNTLPSRGGAPQPSNGNTTRVGGPGAGGMGAENVRNNSSTSPVGPASGYSAPGNIGGGVNPTTGQMQQGVSPTAARGVDRYDGIKTQMDNFNARNPAMDMSRPSASQLAAQYSQYRSPPGATPKSTADLWGGEDVPMDPSVPGRNRASKNYFSKYDLRGVTGPLGEPRVQATPYGSNYQTAQMLRSEFPREIGKYDQTRVTNALNTISKALPGEADLNVNGDIANVMNDLARVSINQMVMGFNPEKATYALDTTGLDPNRSAVRGLQNPGPNSMGMTDRWADEEAGLAAQTRAAQAIQDALFGRGVHPTASMATNFVAAGDDLPRGVNPVGSPINGTQFGIDGNIGGRVPNSYDRAFGEGNYDVTSGSSAPMSTGYSDGRDALSRATSIQPASGPPPNELRSAGAGTWTQPYDTPETLSEPYSFDGEQQRLTVAGGLGIAPFNSMPPVAGFRNPAPAPKLRTDAGMSNWQRDNQYGGVTGSYDPLSSVTASTPRAPTEIDIPGGDLPVAESYDPLGSIKAPRGPMTYPDWRNIGGFEAPSPSYADDGTWGPRDDRDPLGNWYSDPTPADDPERVLEVENVPPEFISPTTQMPPPQLPEKTWPEKVVEKLPFGIGTGARVLRGITSWEWSRLSEQERADLMQKWATDNASYGRYGDSLGGSRQEPPRTSELLGNGNNAYVPVGAGEPPPDDDPKDPNDPNDPWGGRTRVGNPADPYNYGYGPAFNYFTYA